MQDFIISAATEDFWIWSGILTLLALGLGWGMATLFHRARVIENTPTSKLRSAAQGFVELQGTIRAIPGSTLTAPLSQTPCAWFEYEIEKYVGGKHDRWQTVESDESDAPFLLDDGTGTCLVLPAGASITPSFHAVWYGHSRHPEPGSAPREPTGILRIATFSVGSYRYTEKRLMDGDALFCLGNFHTEPDITRLRHVSAAVREALRRLKENPEVLLRHFDRNGDGEIDSTEWERARKATVEHVKSRHGAARGTNSIDVLARPRMRRRPFILSNIPQTDLTRRLKRNAFLCLVGFLATGPLALYLVIQRLQS